ncbi:unnamed protein product [Discosporangium mesarthrocarpum]
MPSLIPTLLFFPRGRRLTRDLRRVRQSLGVCPQQNTLFDSLTVMQHLEVFAVVKGVDARDVQSEADRMVRRFPLSKCI